MMRLRLSLILIVSLVVAACSPPDTSQYDWCFTHNFGDRIYENVMAVDVAEGVWLQGQGIQSQNGGLLLPSVRPNTNFNVRAEMIVIQAQRAPGSSGDINVGAAANIYGVIVASTQTIPSGIESGDIVYYRTGSDTEMDSFSMSVQVNVGDGDIIVNSMRVYGNGANPFTVDNCNPPTPTPQASVDLTALPTSAPTATVDPNACYVYHFDFTDASESSIQGERGFSGLTYQRYIGWGSAVSVNTPTLKQRTVQLERDFSGLPSGELGGQVIAIDVIYDVVSVGAGAQDLRLIINGEEEASADFVVGSGQMLRWKALGTPVESIEIEGIIGQSTTSALPGGQVYVKEVRVWTRFFDIPFYGEFIGLTECEPDPVATVTPTPTPTGTPTTCFVAFYDFRISDFTFNNPQWTSGIGFSGVGFENVIVTRLDINVSNAFVYSGRAITDAVWTYSAQFGENPDPEIELEVDMNSANVISQTVPLQEGNNRVARWTYPAGFLTSGSRNGFYFYAKVHEKGKPPDSDPQGSIQIHSLEIRGIGAPPTGGDWDNATSMSSIPCWDLTPTKTPTATITGTFTPEPSTTATATRTPIGPGGTWTPSTTPFFYTTPSRTPTRTPSTTPPPTFTRTFTPLPPPSQTPSQTFTPRPSWTPNLTRTPIGTLVFASPSPGGGVVPFPTFGGTAAPYEFTPDFEGLPTLDFMGDFYERADNGLGTAAAEIEGLPNSISDSLPLSDTNQTFGQVRWLISGVLLQEAFGRTIAPVPIHIFYGLYITLFMAAIWVVVRVAVAILRVFIWLVRMLLKLIPGIG